MNNPNQDYFNFNKGQNNNEPVDEENQRLKNDRGNNADNDRKQNNAEVDEKLKHDQNVAHEHRLEDQLYDGNSRAAEAMNERIEYDMSNQKKEVRLKLEDKISMELIRRWEVKIYNIYITPQRDNIDAFLQFTIGGDYSVQVFNDKHGKSYKVPAGRRGFSDKTEVQSNVQKLERRPFDKIILTEMRMSYSMINNQSMMIELWDYNSFFMNKIIGYTTVKLIEVVNGSINVSYEINLRSKPRARPQLQAVVEFKILFQEIWDYKISLLNWKLENVLSNRQQKSGKSKLPSLQLSIEFEGRKALDSNTITKSEIIETSTPQFSSFDGVLLYRGSASSFESQNFVVKLISHTSLFSKVISQKVVNLQGIFEFERVKSDFPMVDEITNEKYNVKFEGSMDIEYDTRYKQIGENSTLYSTKKYLCINIMRVENIRPAETRGIVDSFISVEYTGISQRTRTVKENNNPSFNEVLYFLCPIKEEYLTDISKYAQKINEQFAKNNEVIFNLMIEGDDNTYDNLGIATFHLSDIKQGGNLVQKKYFADDLKKEKKYSTKVFTGKLKLVSAFSLSNNTHVNFEAWFLDDFPDIIDFGEKKSKKEMGDKVPVELAYALRNTKETDDFYERFKRKIIDVFRQYVNYSYKERSFLDVYQMDQYKNYHLLPYYLSSISLPNKIFTKEEIEANPYYHDYNLSTLDEVAHFVRCFPVHLENKGDVWSSPDYVVKIRKGSTEDHAILMACLMFGLKKSRKVILEDSKPTPTPNPNTMDEKFHTTNIQSVKDGNDTTDGQNPILINKEEKQEKDKMNSKEPKQITVISEIFPYENRIFVCVGRLKITKQRHLWVMSIGDDYKDITFWDPKMFFKFNLNGRISDPEKMRNYLNMKYDDYHSIRANIISRHNEDNQSDISKQSIKEEKSDYDDKILPYQDNDSQVIRYDEDDIYKDNILNESDIQIQNYGDAAKDNNKKVKVQKNALENQIDDQMLLRANDEEGNKKKINFIEEEKKRMEEELNANNDKFFLPVDEFKDRSGKTLAHISLPYETIDIIFNRNNIYANKQYHDPAHIRYNLYDNKEWICYASLKDDRIWKGKFDNFYSMTNFGPVLSPGLVSKMTNSLIKEIRVGIAAARSGMNLQTKFKKKNEQINLLLRKYLDYQEDLALNRITERQFKFNKSDWKESIKSKMPRFYRMEAKTLFYNYYELETIRRNMTEDIESFFSSKIKNLIFATSAKIFPYLNQAVSVRIILAKFYKIAEEDIEPEDLAEYKLDLQLREQAIKEEEDSFDDEMEEEKKESQKEDENGEDEDKDKDDGKEEDEKKTKGKTDKIPTTKEGKDKTTDEAKTIKEKTEK